MHYVIVPGINGSGPAHWQSLWQRDWADAATRIRPSSWDFPDLDDWCQALDRATSTAREQDAQIALVAHSLGCLAAAHWLRTRRANVRGVFLAAAPDAAGAAFPTAEAASFTGLDVKPIQAPGLLISSADDPYCSPEAAHALAAGWGVGQIEIGSAGHINVSSGLGDWPAGRAMLSAFTAGLEDRADT